MYAGPDEELSQEGQIRHWRNMNRFVAHMTKTKVEILFYDIYCLWSLREPLENPVGTKTFSELYITVPGAAAWMSVKVPPRSIEMERPEGASSGMLAAKPRRAAGDRRLVTIRYVKTPSA